MRETSSLIRILFLFGVAAMAAAVFLLVAGPISQDPAFHDFVDQRAFIGIPNFWNVVSNLAFLVVGAVGIIRLPKLGIESLPIKIIAMVFFVAVASVAVGSSYYHWTPNDHTLFWDRLPMTWAFGAGLALFVADRIDARGGLVLLPVMLIVGAGSLMYWRYSAALGQDDLRFYYIVQAIPFFLVPVMCGLFAGRVTTLRHAIYAALAYGGALACEQFDSEIYAALGHVISGHSIKHVLAAIAVGMIVAMLRTTARAAD